MNFKTWKIKVEFAEGVKHPTPIEEHKAKVAMETTLDHLIQVCDYMPRMDEIVSDLEGDFDPFVVEQIAFEPNVKTIYFVLDFDIED